MSTEVADISSYQDDSLAFMQKLAVYAKSVIIKVTQGSATGDAYVNPKAKTQVANGLKVFKTVGAYHYFKGNSQKYGDSDPINEAKWFDKNLQAIGLDKSTVVAIDVEDPVVMQSATHDINLFLQYLSQQGYKHLVVYASASWFTSGRINKSQLFNNTPIWVAAYNNVEPGVDNAGAWQYTDNGHGLHVDFSYDFDGTLLGEVTTTGTSTGTGTTTPTKPADPMHQHAEQVYTYFNKKGLSDAAICGILGNFQHESYINPTQWQLGMPHTWSMSSSTGYGIAQFTPAGKIKAYADKHGKSVSDINVQLDYIWGQVSTNGFYGGGKTFKQFAHNTNPKTAALDFLRGYEMHQPISDAAAEREKFAANWWTIYNKGNAGTYGVNTRKMDTKAAQATPDGYSIDLSGSFTFDTSCAVRNEPKMSDAGVATYTDGGTVNYDKKIKTDDHFWLSYVSASGVRRYVPYANTATGVYFGNDHNPKDPISSDSGSESTGSGSTSSGSTGETGGTAATTPEMYTISTSGSFTFNTNCRVRSTPVMSDTGVATYTTGMTVNYDSKVKNDNHFWLSYLVSSGARRYVPYGNISKGTYFGSDTTPKDPIKPAE
ncbi:phage tail tip lysozyme [Levilactobacillus mulengensis]|uniref:phage tail tip lysozyme n=1 Tax=Levilactobacillus mulengensis TaxID=2486025 RepID=UPI0013DE29CD|nr:phage tail tip lysozyme [Levilactobacillus mulengensis]